MREVKFRAWHCLSHLMMYGENHHVFQWLEEEKQPIEIMQYTGQKDNQGHEIFEGDLVRYRLNAQYPAEVYFDERSAEFRLRVNKETQYDKTYPLRFAQEVIGNIYEGEKIK